MSNYLFRLMIWPVLSSFDMFKKWKSKDLIRLKLNANNSDSPKITKFNILFSYVGMIFHHRLLLEYSQRPKYERSDFSQRR